MKIGILTFHSQLNYGGVLQCWALQQALTRLLNEKCGMRNEKCEARSEKCGAGSEKCGECVKGERDEVVVIDRWMDAKNDMLNRGYGEGGSRIGVSRLKSAVYSVLRVGDYYWRLRVLRTQKFLSKFINRTPFHFHDWSELKSSPNSSSLISHSSFSPIPHSSFSPNLNLQPQPNISHSSFLIPHCPLDLLVVGSDQVWHCGDWGDPRAYLLEGVESNLSNPQPSTSTSNLQPRVISYAASFGMKELPQFLRSGDGEMAKIKAEPLYRRGLARFGAISCREQEGVEICRKLGFGATHVVDPTQLLSAADWTPLAKVEHRRQLTCYFLSEDVDAALPQLRAFASRTKCRVKILVYDSPRYHEWLPTPNSPRTLYHWLRGMVKRIVRWRVRVCEDAGPVEFVRAHAECAWVITDSFHSLMFATTFGKNVRVLRPQSAMRRKMFSRMEEYAAHASGPLLSDNLASALSSLERGESAAIDSAWLSDRREQSLDFLRCNLKEADAIHSSTSTSNFN